MDNYHKLEMEILRNYQIASTRFEKFWKAYQNALIIYGLVFGISGIYMFWNKLSIIDKTIYLIITGNFLGCFVIAITLSFLVIPFTLCYGESVCRFCLGSISLIHRVSFW